METSIVVLPYPASKVIIVEEECIITVKVLIVGKSLSSLPLDAVVVIVVVHISISLRESLIILIHELKVDLVVDLESASLNFLLPHLIVELDVVKYRVNQLADVRVLI